MEMEYSDKGKPIIFTNHAIQRIKDRGASKDNVLEAIRIGECEPAQRGCYLYRLNLEFKKMWDGRFYGIQQVAPVVKEEEDKIVVITVYTFYFQEGGKL